MYSQVQLKYEGEKYFVADQVFVKRNATNKIIDLVVIESKLKITTPLTTNQSAAFKKTLFTVRSLEARSEMGTRLDLESPTVISFEKESQIYKVYSDEKGDVIRGIIKQ